MGSQEPAPTPQRHSARFLEFGYFAHIFLVLLLFMDCLYMRYKGYWSRSVLLVSAVVTVWLVVALGAFYFSRNRTAFLAKMAEPLLTFFTLTGLVLGAEGSLQLFSDSTLYLRPPGSKFVHESDDRVTPGIRPGKKTYSANNVGLRGPDFPREPDSAYKLVALGGSTTLCIALDDSEHWPRLLMDELNARPNRRVWVGNAGIDGKTTVDNLKLLQTLPIFRKVQAVIILAGVNDLQASLAREGAPTNDFLNMTAANFIDRLRPSPHARDLLLSRSHVYRLAVEGYHAVQARRKPPAETMNAFLERNRKRRSDAGVSPLPDLRIGLTEYRGRILALDDACRIRNLRCLFLTQPTMWREDLPPAERKLQWFGWIGPGDAPKGYASLGDLARAMNAYNQELLDTCTVHGMECYDLAAHVPKDSSAMYDDCHFNENGSRLVAHLLSGYLDSHDLRSAN